MVQKRYEEWRCSKAALEREQKARQQKKMAEKAAQEKEVHTTKFQKLFFYPSKTIGVHVHVQY